MSEAQEIETHWDPAAELREDFWTAMRRELRVLQPVQNTRASSIGHECERFLVYEQHPKLAELRAPPSPELQAIFELGKYLETYVVQTLEHKMDIEIVQRGRDYRDPRYQISGHVDAKIKRRTWPKALTAEIKGLNPFTAGKTTTLDDIRHHPSAWVRGYYAQLQMYLFLASEERGLFVLLNKSTGRIEFIECPLDYAYTETLIRRAERVRDYLAADELPQKRLSSECERCAFRAPCAPDLDYGPGVAVLNDEELARLLDQRGALEKAKREYDALDKAIKKKLPEHEQVVVGDWVVAGKKLHNSGYRVEPYDYWRRDFRQIEKTAQSKGEEIPHE